MSEISIDTLKTMLANLDDAKKYQSLRDVMETLPAPDLAAVFEDLPAEKLPVLFRLCPKDLAADVFTELTPETQQKLIDGLTDTELKAVVDELCVDDATDLVEEMPANVVKRILRQADPEMRKMINEILKYPDDCAGSIMTTEYVSLRPNMTAGEAIQRIRCTGVDKETIYTCYVTENNRKLVGMVSLRTLLFSEDEDVLENIMESNVISVNTLEDQESVAQMFTKYDFAALPVVDQENRLVGMKSRGVYENPAGKILFDSHQILETITLDRATAHYKDMMAIRFAELVYDGCWNTPLREAMSAFADSTQQNVTGTVRVKLYKGNVIPAGVKSPYSLYMEEIATFGDSKELYDHKDSAGFINLFGLPLKVQAMMKEKNAK